MTDAEYEEIRRLAIAPFPEEHPALHMHALGLLGALRTLIGESDLTEDGIRRGNLRASARHARALEMIEQGDRSKK